MTFSMALTSMAVMLKICLSKIKHWKEPEQNKKMMFETSTSACRKTVQCSLLLIVEPFVSDDGWEFGEGGQACYQLWTYTASLFYAQWETRISECLCPKAVCAFQNIDKKDKSKVNTFQKCERILVPVFQLLWTIPEAPWAEDLTWGFGYYSCFVSLLICVIWVSIKHYEIQSVQIDISKSYFHPYG